MAALINYLLSLAVLFCSVFPLLPAKNKSSFQFTTRSGSKTSKNKNNNKNNENGNLWAHYNSIKAKK